MGTRIRVFLPLVGAFALALASPALAAQAASKPSAGVRIPPPPRPAGSAQPQPRGSVSVAPPAASGDPLSGSPWQALTNPPPFNPGAMLLLTDGTVLVQDQGPDNNGSSNWWLLTPDSSGNYLDGTWSQVASLPSTYAPLYYASAVLPDGNVIIEGGEYNHGHEVWSNKGALYDPLTDTWTMVKHPKGSEWSRIGDAPGTVLADGKFMVGASGYSGTTAEAILSAKLRWTATGSGKADGNGEEGWSLLPNGDVLTVDTTNTPNSEIYNPATGSWTSAGDTPVSLVDATGEIGPQLLQPDGTVFAVGATGATATYDTALGTWSAGPSLPVIDGQQYDSADGSAAVLPDGNVLLNASPGDYQTPTHFFVFDGTSLTQVPDAPNAGNQSSDDGFMLVLPTGQVLFNDRIGQMELYTDDGPPLASWQPTITSVPSTLTAGDTYKVKGTQLGGLTQASAYGDDYQSATNYPLLRITNTATGDVVFARTSGFSSMSVAPGAASSAEFTLPAGIGTGPSSLVVVANGIASAPRSVTVESAS